MALTDSEIERAKQAKREYQREWNKNHRDKANEYQRKWNKAHPDKIREINLRYWAKRAMADQAQDTQ